MNSSTRIDSRNWYLDIREFITFPIYLYKSSTETVEVEDDEEEDLDDEEEGKKISMRRTTNTRRRTRLPEPLR